MTDTASPSSHSRAWITGFGLCLLAGLASQPFLGAHAVPGAPTHPLAQTFTGITLLLGAGLYWRLPRRTERPPTPATWLLTCALCMVPALLGWLLALDGGTLRHARTFTLLPPLMFLAFAPRPARTAPPVRSTP